MKTLALCLAILSAIGLVGTAFAQEDEVEFAQEVEVINSKYLEITDNKYSVGDQAEIIISGTVKNISPEEIGYVTVYTSLYNHKDELLTVLDAEIYIEDKPAIQTSLLQPGEEGPFEITFNQRNLRDFLHHYSLMPGGLFRLN